jgi:CRP/FNR family cyclic AMP-dependent transcriptional regulator
VPNKKVYPPSSSALFKRIAQRTASRDYKHNEVVFHQGAKADAMYYLQSGNVKLVVEAKNGKKAVLAILRKGDLFGEGCLGRESLRTCSAMAIQPSTLARVTRAAIVRIIQQEPAFAKLFIAYLVARIGRIEEDIVDQIFSSSEKRLARLLLISIQARARAHQDQPGNPRRNDRHDTIQGEPLHESIPKAGTYPL